MITKKEYILLNILKEEFRYCFLTKDKDGSLMLFSEKPEKFYFTGRWTAPDESIRGHLDFFVYEYFGENMFQCIKWEDENVKRVKDYIKEYEQWQNKIEKK